MRIPGLQRPNREPDNAQSKPSVPPPPPPPGGPLPPGYTEEGRGKR